METKDLRKLNDREIATILHALRSIQYQGPFNDGCQGACDHFDEVERLSEDEIDTLCESINFDLLYLQPDSARANTNCLAGMKCPKCGYIDSFDIGGFSVFTMTDDGDTDHRDIDWEGDSPCYCNNGGCGYSGTVSDFMIKEKKNG